MIFASREAKDQSHVLLCCMALAVLSTSGSLLRTQNDGEQTASSQPSGEDNPSPSAEFAAHGRRLHVRVSPWLSSMTGRAAAAASANVDAISKQRKRRGSTGASVHWRNSKYVIVGLGVTGNAALQALLECEPDAEITVVEMGTEPSGFEQPHRPGGASEGGRLGGLLRGRRGTAFPRVTYLWGTAVESMDADGKVLSLSDGSKLAFDKCLLAVGEGPVQVPSRFVDRVVAGRVVSLYGAEDRRALGRLVAQGHHVTIVGSNWASVELASFLSDVARRHGWGRTSVTLLFPESTPLAKELPRYLSGLLLRRLERRGVEVIPHTCVKYIGRAMDYEVQSLRSSFSAPASSVENSDTRTEANSDVDYSRLQRNQEPTVSFDSVRVYLTSKFASLDSTALLTDQVVVGGSSAQGRLPVLRFEGHPLEVDERTGGLVVSHELQASSSVFVAGDAAFFPCTDMGKRVMVRSADHAYHSGWVAGMNMTGRGVRYQHLPLFFGTIPRLGVRAAWVGQCDGSAETHGFWWKNSTNGGSSNSMARKRTRMDGFVPLPEAQAAEEGGLAGRVKGAFQSLVSSGSSSKKRMAADNTSSALAAVGIGTTGRGEDSNSGRKLGIFRRTTTDRELGDLDAVIEAEMESEAFNAGKGGKIFTSVNGTGLVFYMDSDGTVRGILAWGLPPPATPGEDADPSEIDGQSPQPPRIGSLGAIDPVLGGVIERARAAVADGVRSGTAFKYDMNSRQDTLSALRALALEVVGPETVEQLGPKPPLYTYTSAKSLSTTTHDTLFRINNHTRSSADLLEEAYEAAVKGHMQPTPGTSTVPFPFNRS